jgi:hypothetical protein
MKPINIFMQDDVSSPNINGSNKVLIHGGRSFTYMMRGTDPRIETYNTPFFVPQSIKTF